MIRTKILGVGHHVPDFVVTNDDLAKMFDTSDEWIQQRSGIQQRRWVHPDNFPCGVSDLSIPAVKMAASNAGIDIEEIDCIIFATLSSDHVFPGSACFLQDKLGLADREIACLDVRNQCSGFLYAMQIADAYIRCGMYKKIALVGAEIHSSGLDKSTKGRDVTVLFGDGAGCIILGPTEDEGIIEVEIHADGRGAKDLWTEGRSASYADSLTHEMIDRGASFPSMNGKQVFRHAVIKMPEVMESVLKKSKYTMNDVALFVPHQANLRIIEAAAQRLEVPRAKVMVNIHKYGNTTAASMPLALSEAMIEGRAKKGDLIAFASFGAGFTWGAALVRL